MSEQRILDLLERAYHAGVFVEVLKMIKAKTSPTMIEKVIEKAIENQQRFDPFIDFDLFGSD